MTIYEELMRNIPHMIILEIKIGGGHNVRTIDHRWKRSVRNRRGLAAAAGGQKERAKRAAERTGGVADVPGERKGRRGSVRGRGVGCCG